jgi:ubiquinone/menaquinone biosynthesis C-methylase UbiE
MTEKKHVCPWWLCFTFDNPLRKLIHNPEAILSPFVRSGDRVIDIGAGMGYFSIPLARLVGSQGQVTAIDLQPQMLSVLVRRAQRAGVAERVNTYQAAPDSLGEHPPADFVLAFWMVHEVPEQRRFLTEISRMVKSGGQFLLVEPKMHVTGKSFFETLEAAKENGFTLKVAPSIRLSHSALLGIDRSDR